MRSETIKAVEVSFSSVSAKRTHPQVRDDAHQSAWAALLKRRSTKWDDEKKLDSQATNACLSAIIQEAKACRFDRRVTLSALEWERLEENQYTPWESEDPESLCSHAKLLLRIKAIKVAKTMQPRFMREQYRTTATRLAMCRQTVPTRGDIQCERLSEMVRDLH
jgi:hypothetical protein